MSQKCSKCYEIVSDSSKYLQCKDCEKIWHLNCIGGLTEVEYDYLKDSQSWSCNLCSLISRRNRNDESPIRAVSSEGRSPGDYDYAQGPAQGALAKIKCSSCNKGFAHNAYKLVCGKCQLHFHIKCLNVSKDKYAAVCNDWTCDQCAGRSTQVDRSKSNDEPTLKDVMKFLLAFKSEVTTQNKNMEEALNIYSDRVEECNGKIDVLTSKLDRAMNEIHDLRATNSLLQGKVVELERNVNLRNSC
jgi:hypothetical protein